MGDKPAGQGAGFIVGGAILLVLFLGGSFSGCLVATALGRDTEFGGGLAGFALPLALVLSFVVWKAMSLLGYAVRAAAKRGEAEDARQAWATRNGAFALPVAPVLVGLATGAIYAGLSAKVTLGVGLACFGGLGLVYGIVLVILARKRLLLFID